MVWRGESKKWPKKFNVVHGQLLKAKKMELKIDLSLLYHMQT